MSEAQWKQFVQLFAQKNPQLTKQQVLQQAKKPFLQLKKYFSQRGGAGNSMQQMMRDRASRLQARNTATASAASAAAEQAAAEQAAQEENLKPIKEFIYELDNGIRIIKEFIKYEEDYIERAKKKGVILSGMRERENGVVFHVRVITGTLRKKSSQVVGNPFFNHDYAVEIRTKLSELISLLPNIKFMDQNERYLTQVGKNMDELIETFRVDAHVELEYVPTGKITDLANSIRAEAPAPAPAKPLISDDLRKGINAYLRTEKKDRTQRNDRELIQHLKELGPHVYYGIIHYIDRDRLGPELSKLLE